MAAELATTLTPTPDDRLLQAEALVRAFCDWHIAPVRAQALVVKKGPGSAVLVLPSLQIATLTSVTDDGTVIDPADFQDYTDGLLTHPTGCWSTGRIEVVVTHGFETPPPDVTAVVQAVAQRAVQNPGSLVRKQVGPFGDTYSQTAFNQSVPLALFDGEKDQLRPYRVSPRP